MIVMKVTSQFLGPGIDLESREDRLSCREGIPGDPICKGILIDECHRKDPEEAVAGMQTCIEDLDKARLLRYLEGKDEDRA